MYIAGTSCSVDTGNTYFNKLGTSLAQQVLRTRELIKRKPVSAEIPLSAHINHGRWLVACPNCNNVEFVFEDGLFFCSQCGQDEIRWVVLPEERKQIEDILGKRMIINRHWSIKETVESLQAENIAHGIKEV